MKVNRRWKVTLGITTLLTAFMWLLCSGDYAGAQESPSYYMYYEHRTIVSDPETTAFNGAVICTLGIYAIDALIDAENDVVDSTFEKHLVGVNTLVLSVKVDSVSGDSAQIDSLWWDIHSENDLGPLDNPDGSSVVIGKNTTGTGLYGPFGVQSYSGNGKNYPLRVTRGRGLIYIMAATVGTDSQEVIHELWEAKR